MEEKIVKYLTEEEAKNVTMIAGAAAYSTGVLHGLLTTITGVSAGVIVITFIDSVIKRKKTKLKYRQYGTKKEL